MQRRPNSQARAREVLASPYSSEIRKEVRGALPSANLLVPDIVRSELQTVIREYLNGTIQAEAKRFEAVSRVTVRPSASEPMLRRQGFEKELAGVRTFLVEIGIHPTRSKAYAAALVNDGWDDVNRLRGLPADRIEQICSAFTVHLTGGPARLFRPGDIDKLKTAGRDGPPVAEVPRFAAVLDPRTVGTLSQRATIAQPLATGLTYYATDEEKLYVYTGSTWRAFVDEARIAALEAQVAELDDHTHQLMAQSSTPIT